MLVQRPLISDCTSPETKLLLDLIEAFNELFVFSSKNKEFETILVESKQ